MEASVKRELDSTPIEVDQRWVALSDEGEELRVVRILAKHPNGGWIFQDEKSLFYPLGNQEIRVTPEFNLRYVFRCRQ